jgi:hypothetical protein
MDRRSGKPGGRFESNEHEATLRRSVQQVRAAAVPPDVLARALLRCRFINSAKSLWFYAILRGAAGVN